MRALPPLPVDRRREPGHLVNSNRDKLVVKADRRGIDIDVVNTGGEVIKRHRIDK